MFFKISLEKNKNHIPNSKGPRKQKVQKHTCSSPQKAKPSNATSRFHQLLRPPAVTRDRPRSASVASPAAVPRLEVIGAQGWGPFQLLVVLYVFHRVLVVFTWFYVVLQFVSWSCRCGCLSSVELLVRCDEMFEVVFIFVSRIGDSGLLPVASPFSITFFFVSAYVLQVQVRMIWFGATNTHT